MPKRAVVLLALISSWGTVSADVANCQSMYVGQVLVQNGVNFRATFLSNPSDTSGSQWIYFNHWNAEDKKAALALLTAAKMSEHRVELVTEAAGGCDITIDQQLAKMLYLATNP